MTLQVPARVRAASRHCGNNNDSRCYSRQRSGHVKMTIGGDDRDSYHNDTEKVPNGENNNGTLYVPDASALLNPRLTLQSRDRKHPSRASQRHRQGRRQLEEKCLVDEGWHIRWTIPPFASSSRDFPSVLEMPPKFPQSLSCIVQDAQKALQRQVQDGDSSVGRWGIWMQNLASLAHCVPTTLDNHLKDDKNKLWKNQERHAIRHFALQMAHELSMSSSSFSPSNQDNLPVALYFSSLSQTLWASQECKILPQLQGGGGTVQVLSLTHNNHLPIHLRVGGANKETKKISPKESRGWVVIVLDLEAASSSYGVCYAHLQQVLAQATMAHLSALVILSSSLQQSSPGDATPWVLRDVLPPVYSWTANVPLPEVEPDVEDEEERGGWDRLALVSSSSWNDWHVYAIGGDLQDEEQQQHVAHCWKSLNGAQHPRHRHHQQQQQQWPSMQLLQHVWRKWRQQHKQEGV